MSTSMSALDLEAKERVIKKYQTKLFFLALKQPYLVALLATSLAGPATLHELITKFSDTALPKDANPFTKNLYYAMKNILVDKHGIVLKECSIYHTYNIQNLFTTLISSKQEELRQAVIELKQLALDFDSNLDNLKSLCTKFFDTSVGKALSNIDRFILNHLCESTHNRSTVPLIPKTHYGETTIYNHLRALETRGWLSRSTKNGIALFELHPPAKIIANEIEQLERKRQMLDDEKESVDIKEIYMLFDQEPP